jgi:hypothetical protein
MNKFAGRPLALGLGVALVLTCIATERAAAQPNPNLESNFGSVKLKSGFKNDPYKKELVAGGGMVVTMKGVRMNITRKPDFKLYYTRSDNFDKLHFYVRAKADTTLLINLPNAQFVADDDSGGNRNPLITVRNPQSGRYDIWVGTFFQGNAPATLYITELPVTKPIPPPR